MGPVANRSCRFKLSVLPLFLLALLMLPVSASADVAGGTTIHNAATLTFDGGRVSASVDVGVNTVAAAPTITVDSTADNAYPGEDRTYTYTIVNNANGSDSFSLKAESTDDKVNGPALKFPSGAENTTLTLGGSVTNRASDAAGNVYIPAGSESNLAKDDTIVVDGVGTYTIASISPGTPAKTDASNNTTTPEVPTVLTLTPVGAAPAIDTNTIPTGTQLGERITVSLTVTAGILTGEGDGTHTVNLSGQTTATRSGSAVTYATAQGDGNEVVVTVVTPQVTLTKEVKNFTAGEASFRTSGVLAQSGDTLEYRIIAKPAAAGDLTSCVLADDLPEYTEYVTGTMTLNDDPVVDGGAFPLAGGGLAVNSPGGASGVIKQGEEAVIIFQVTVQ